MDILIFGTGSFAHLMHHYIEKFTDWHVLGFVVDAEYACSDTFDGLPLLKTESVMQVHPPSRTGIVLAVGYKSMNKVRMEKYEWFRSRGYDLPSFIHPSVINDSAEVGQGNIVLEGSVLGPFSRLGNANLIWNACAISHDVSIGSFNTIAGGCFMAGRARIGDRCFLGANATIKNGAVLSDLTFVGASCYINANTQRESAYIAAATQPVKRMTSLDVQELMETFAH